MEGHGALPRTKKMPNLDIILKVVIPIRPLHSFFPFQNLCLYQACLRRDLLSHMIANINCKCNLNGNLARYSTNFLCKTSKITLKKWAVSVVLIMRKKLLLSPCIQHKNFNYLIPLYPSMVTGSHLLRILIFRLWLPGDQEGLMARQFSIKCMSILKIITRNGLEKKRKRKYDK